MDSDPDSAGGTSSSGPRIPNIGYLTEPLSLQELKEFTWGGTSEPDEFNGIPDNQYGQMFVYDTKPGSKEGIKTCLDKAGLDRGDEKYRKLLKNLYEELEMLERRATKEGKELQNLHWEVIVDTDSSDVVSTFVFAKDD